MILNSFSRLGRLGNKYRCYLTKTKPESGDLLFIDARGKKHFLKGGDDLDVGIIPSSWTWVGAVIDRTGNNVLILDKASVSMKWLACWQYAITSINSTDITISLRMSNDYVSYTDVAVALTNAVINEQSASEISAAVSEKAIEVGDNNDWWAWYDSVNNRIIVQTDSCISYLQYSVAGIGCSISLCVWEDMPSGTALLRNNGASSNYGGINPTRFIEYYSINGITPTSNINPNDASNVKRSCFENPSDAAYAYCASLRDVYGTYEKYMESQLVMYPQSYGAFSLIDAVEMTVRYGNSTAPTKGGGMMYKFPALHYGATVNYDSDGLRTGDWHLSDITDGMIYMVDKGYNTGISNNAVKQKYNHSIAKMGGAQVYNNSYRWFARRYSFYLSWHFGGTGGTLANSYITGTHYVQAVTLLKI